MFKLLVKTFIKDSDNTKSVVVREKYGFLSGIVGIIVNVFLTVCKFIIGSMTNSIAIIGDAINNLSDAGSCVVTLVGFKMASRKPDNEHPFGHGRIEYVAALIVGFFVELMGFELIKSSIEKIRNPEEVTFSVAAVIVLLISIAGKIWLALFNRYLGKKIDSPTMSAVVADSISDTTATTATLFALVISKFISFPIDGYIGIIVSLFILYSGYGILKETIGILLGNPPSKELVDELVSFIMSHNEIKGIHDLVIHTYGATMTFASIHVEVPADGDIITIHDTIDTIEHEVKERFDIDMVIHMDPIVMNDEKVDALKNMVTSAISEIDTQLHIHDFRMVAGPTHTNLIFDLVVPHNYKYSERQLKEMVNEKICKSDNRYYVVMTVENSYI